MGVGSYISIAFIMSLLMFEIIASIIIGVKEQNGEPTNTKVIIG